MSASIERFIARRGGGANLPSSAAIGPWPAGSRSLATHCFMMRTDWRISSMRITWRS